MRWQTLALLVVLFLGIRVYWNLWNDFQQLEAENAELMSALDTLKSQRENISSSLSESSVREQKPDRIAQEPIVNYNETAASVTLARQQAQLRAISDYNAAQSKLCRSDTSSYKHISDSIVQCGCEYDGYHHSRDGTTVCTGGRYENYQHSRDGTDVACGFQYGNYQHSRDGHRVCAGGKYENYQHSRDGTRVACGGRYEGYQKSRDGSMTCYGGRYRR